MSSNPFSSFVKSAKKKIDRHGDGSHDGKRHNDPLLHLSTKKLGKIAPEQLDRYSNKDLESLPTERLQVLPAEVLSRLDHRVLDSLPGETIAKLSTAAQLRLHPRALAKIPIDILATIDSDVLFHALPGIHPEELRGSKLENAIHRIGHQRLQQLHPDVRKNLSIPVPAPDPQLPIQKHDISMHPLNKGLPTLPQSTHDFGMSTEYLDSHPEQQQQPRVMSLTAHYNNYNTANVDTSAFSSPTERSAPYESSSSPTYTSPGGRMSPNAVKSVATVPATAYPPKSSDSRPSYAPRRNSSVSRGSHTRARSSSRHREREREREYHAYTPGPVAVAEYGPPKFAELPRDISEMGLPTPPVRSSSRLYDDLSVSDRDREVIKRAESWNDKPTSPRGEISRKETPKASRESIARDKEDSMSRSMSPPTTSTSTPSSPEVASFAERQQRAAAQGQTTSRAKDDADSTYTHQVFQEHMIKELKAESERLNNQLVNAKAKNIALLDRLDKYLNEKKPSKTYRGDAIDVIIAYCEEICDVNTKNFQASRDWEDRYLSEKKHREEVEDDLDHKSQELRAVKDKLLGLQTRVGELNKHNTELQTQESSLRNDLGRLERDNKELHKKCEKQKAHSDTAIENIRRQHESDVAQLRQTVAEHDIQMRAQQEHYETQLRNQKEGYAQEMQKQRLYYEGQVNSAHQQLADQAELHQTLLAQKTQDVQDTIATMRSQHKEEFNSLEAASNEQISALQASHNQQIAAQQKKHEQDIQRLNKRHARNVVDLKEKVQSLENDLVLGNNDDFRPATDDGLKIQYRQLKLCVDMVTEPINLGISGVPKNLGKLDPTRFLEREGKNQLRFLLRSVVWQKIVEGFFSEPFGFGALGNKGEGREVLRRVVDGWRGLCGYDDGRGSLSNGSKASRSSTTDTDILTPFFHSRDANKWRSATFQSILMAVAPPSSSNSRKGQQQQAPSPSGTPGPPENPANTPYHNNVNQVQSQIIALLSSICSEPLSPEIQSKVSELARQAGELALQFGAQRAQLGLEVPKRGEQVKIGTESGWVDCEDGDSFGGRRGVEVEVDLCVSPKVYRVGDMDGRNMGDKKGAKMKAIVAGEVYPRRS
ncbi:hypothetical protein SMAC4_08181 [Sordaria macrospora]|uniref:uncharacterized protein n=1 Tax=Sordaria macrospora TaxID=5147 RepID=UPI001D4235DC|nr:hypothetical protein B0T09DRAFT_325587 [Sordaria sp. MPI-SDFR-AT-0083]WPJ65157.1 hypothetical protein SMAC4_08181 [Sordaria macrospora]